MHKNPKSRNLITAAVLGIVGLGLVGCSGGLSSVSPGKATITDFAQYRSASRDGVVHTVIVGTIANADNAQVQEVVNQAFSTIHIGPPTVFSSAADTVDIRNPRIVVLFSPKRSFGPSQICNNDEALSAARTEPEGDQIRVIGAFCVGSALKTWSILNGTAPASTEDPALYQIAQRMAFDIIPERSSKTPGDCLSNC